MSCLLLTTSLLPLLMKCFECTLRRLASDSRVSGRKLCKSLWMIGIVPSWKPKKEKGSKREQRVRLRWVMILTALDHVGVTLELIIDFDVGYQVAQLVTDPEIATFLASISHIISSIPFLFLLVLFELLRPLWIHRLIHLSGLRHFSTLLNSYDLPLINYVL